ncbi:MAG: hypothetical protein ACFFCV_04950 [Promethearchaeota archaeon]
MISKAKKYFELNNIDNGIAPFIQEINSLGYKTIMSCSGMKKDHKETEKCPFICFERPRLSGEEMILFLRFLGDCLYNSNWDVEYFSCYVIGYLPRGLDDPDIKKRFKKFLANLKNRDIFTHSY